MIKNKTIARFTALLSLCTILIPIFKLGFNYLWTNQIETLLWDLSLWTVFLVMIIRPLANLFPSAPFKKWIPLRKEFGILSASIVVMFGIAHYCHPDFNFLSTYFSLDYWSFEKNKFYAHLSELLGFILLVTSNTHSTRWLKRNWKRIQRFAYLYFYAGTYYVYATVGKDTALYMMIIVTLLWLSAEWKRRRP